MAPIMKENLLKLQIGKDQDVNMHNNVKYEILNNKDDLVEGTFCYLLFKDGEFSPSLLKKLIEKSEFFLKNEDDNIEVKNLLDWVIRCVDQCFSSHKDIDDYYSIKNYSIEFEEKWSSVWKPSIERIVNI